MDYEANCRRHIARLYQLLDIAPDDCRIEFVTYNDGTRAVFNIVRGSRKSDMIAAVGCEKIDATLSAMEMQLTHAVERATPPKEPGDEPGYGDTEMGGGARLDDPRRPKGGNGNLGREPTSDERIEKRNAGAGTHGEREREKELTRVKGPDTKGRG